MVDYVLISLCHDRIVACCIAGQREGNDHGSSKVDRQLKISLFEFQTPNTESGLSFSMSFSFIVC